MFIVSTPPVKFLPSCAGSTISAVDNGLYEVCFTQRNCSDCSCKSIICNAERDSPHLEAQSWLCCDGVECGGEMQSRVQSDAPQCHEQIGPTQDPLFSEIVTKPLPMVILFKLDH